MALITGPAPFVVPRPRVATVMARVLVALLPGIAALAAVFGWGVIVQVLWASALAWSLEAVLLWLRRRPLRPFLGDYSALVTAWLLAIALPPLAPWWVGAVGVVFAIAVAKHLYGGLGYNPFNPAMVGYCAVLVAFPREMIQWPVAGADPAFHLPAVLGAIFIESAGLDGFTGATPLDAARTHLVQYASFWADPLPPLWDGGPKGWAWPALAFGLGGLWLVASGAASWRIPVAVLGSLGLLAALFHAIDPSRYASPLFHLVAGSGVVGALFIATDPVSASTTPRGRWLYGAGIGALIYAIRTFGGYPDGVAFAVLLMNSAAPTIDRHTQPRVFGAPRRTP
ncbi:MAG: RnfABCDGE type electron transport complex subunit D [Candidatus Competibacterales bacterium]